MARPWLGLGSHLQSEALSHVGNTCSHFPSRNLPFSSDENSFPKTSNCSTFGICCSVYTEITNSPGSPCQWLGIAELLGSGRFRPTWDSHRGNLCARDLLGIALPSEASFWPFFLHPCLSWVSDLPCGLKALSAWSCLLSPFFFPGVTSNKSLVLLTPSWHLVPGEPFQDHVLFTYPYKWRYYICN